MPPDRILSGCQNLVLVNLVLDIWHWRITSTTRSVLIFEKVPESRSMLADIVFSSQHPRPLRIDRLQLCESIGQKIRIVSNPNSTKEFVHGDAGAVSKTFDRHIHGIGDSDKQV